MYKDKIPVKKINSYEFIWLFTSDHSLVGMAVFEKKTMYIRIWMVPTVNQLLFMCMKFGKNLIIGKISCRDSKIMYCSILMEKARSQK
jgi:hypothetical protein